MATRTERIEARATPDEAARIRYAAGLQRVSLSSFVVIAAASRAEEVIASHSETIVPAEYFNHLLEALDEPPRVLPGLASAVDRARRQGHK
ncbi:MAG: DUF1778 domain-containing protein [Chloroflexi bacterium]|nr:DUF1778 domain-containing protein [Chloroflexota bacterium]